MFTFDIFVVSLVEVIEAARENSAVHELVVESFVGEVHKTILRVILAPTVEDEYAVFIIADERDSVAALGGRPLAADNSATGIEPLARDVKTCDAHTVTVDRVLDIGKTAALVEPRASESFDLTDVPVEILLLEKRVESALEVGAVSAGVPVDRLGVEIKGVRVDLGAETVLSPKDGFGEIGSGVRGAEGFVALVLDRGRVSVEDQFLRMLDTGAEFKRAFHFEFLRDFKSAGVEQLFEFIHLRASFHQPSVTGNSGSLSTALHPPRTRREINMTSFFILRG